ncbi:hypothetical protein ABVT39_021067 [Epinephelus coioides]
MWKLSQRNSSSKLQHFQGYIPISVGVTTVLSRQQAVPIRKSLAFRLYWLTTGAAYRSSDIATATFCSFDKPHRHCVDRTTENENVDTNHANQLQYTPSDWKL